jgi:hemolysin activation/secretion protein
MVMTNFLYQNIQLTNDPERFFAKDITQPQGNDYSSRQYFGPELRYLTQFVDDPLLPKKGVEGEAGISYTYNFDHTDRSFTRYDGVIQFYIPLFKPLTLAVRAGGSTLIGDPDFFQLNRLGGAFNLRGYIRDRFYGKTTAYNNNELQWYFPVRSKLFNGQMALIGLYDIGRVWMTGENSDTWHTAYGGGLTLVPFNKLSVTVTYSTSRENSLAHFRIRRSFGKR